MMEAVTAGKIHGDLTHLEIRDRVVLDDLKRWGYVIGDGGVWRATPAGSVAFDTWKNLKDVGGDNADDHR